MKLAIVDVLLYHGGIPEFYYVGLLAADVVVLVALIKTGREC